MCLAAELSPREYFMFLCNDTIKVYVGKEKNWRDFYKIVL